jgi:hypothetical protein
LFYEFSWVHGFVNFILGITILLIVR